MVHGVSVDDPFSVNFSVDVRGVAARRLVDEFDFVACVLKQPCQSHIPTMKETYEMERKTGKPTKFSDEATVLVEGLGEILEEHAVVFSGHEAELGEAIAAVLGGVTEIDLANRHVVRNAVNVGGSHLVICLDDEMVWWIWEGMIEA